MSKRVRDVNIVYTTYKDVLMERKNRENIQFTSISNGDDKESMETEILPERKRGKVQETIKQDNSQLLLYEGHTRSVEKRIVRMSFPWLLSKAVLKTTAMQPPSGVFKVPAWIHPAREKNP